VGILILIAALAGVLVLGGWIIGRPLHFDDAMDFLADPVIPILVFSFISLAFVVVPVVALVYVVIIDVGIDLRDVLAPLARLFGWW